MTEFEQLRAAIDAKMSTNPQIRHILKLIESGKASFNDSAKYTQILSHLLGRELASQILELSDREGTTTQLLRGAYDEVNDLCSQVQSSLDKKAGIGLNPKQAPFPAERVEQYAHSLVDPTVEDSVIKRRAGAGSETITKSYHDDYIETNAEFREDAGFKCYIIRMGTDCCQWCSDVAGKYEMKDQPQGIFRRHDNCDCTIIYDGQVLRGQTGAEGKRGKKWVEVPNKAGAADAVRFSQVQAKALNDKKVEINVPTIDIAVKRGIIKVEKENAVTISSIETPIEKKHTGKGNPNAINTFGVELNNRQKELLDKLPDYDCKILVPKASVNMADLSALTAKTGHEFAMFTKNNERLIIRGNEKKVNINIDDAKQLAKEGYRWSGHTHPGMDILVIQPSDGDYAILNCFKHNMSVIYNSKGEFRTFEKRK